MKAGERFHMFLGKMRFLRKMKKQRFSSGLLPANVMAAVQNAWSNAFAFQGEEPWDMLCASGAHSVICEFPWLAPFRGEIERLISNY